MSKQSAVAEKESPVAELAREIRKQMVEIAHGQSFDVEAHQARMAERRKQQQERYEETVKCLDPAYAQERELEKPRYKYTVSAKWATPGNLKECREFTHVVIATSPDEAWSCFCDQVGEWPGRRACFDGGPKIETDGKPISVAEFVASESKKNKHGMGRNG